LFIKKNHTKNDYSENINNKLRLLFIFVEHDIE